MTLRTSISSAEQARMLDGSGAWMIKAEIRRRTESTWTDLTDVAGGDWTLAVEADISTPDTSVSRFTVRLLRSADGYSLSPGISGSSLNQDAASVFSPLVYPRRYIRVFAYCADTSETRADAVWHPWLTGEIERVAFEDDVVASCVGPDARIQRRQIKAKEDRGSPDPGIPLQLEVQGLLDRWMGAGEIALTTVGDPEMSLGEYQTEVGSLGDFLLSQARRVGWDLRYRWDDEEEDYRYTLYLPPRDKTTPDLVISASRVRQVPGLEVDADPVRNDFTHTRRDAVTKRITTLNLTNAESIAEYDDVWMGITEDEDSPINTEAKAMALLQFASSDLGQPPVDGRHEIPFLPFLDLHHMVRFEADGEMFDYDIDVSVVGGSHKISADDASTLINDRPGAPVGMYYAWRRRNRGGAAQHDWLIVLVEPVGALETDTTYTYRITGGDDVYEIWGAYALEDGEPTEEAWTAVAAVAEAGNVLSTTPTATITVAKPTSLQVGLLYVVPKILDAGSVVTPPTLNAAKYVSVHGPPAIGPTLDVVATAGATEYTITWSGDSVEMSTDGVTFSAPPASPFTVTRPAADEPPLVYSFRGTKDGILATDRVYILPLGVEVVPVDLAVTPVAVGTDNARATFTATAARLDTMASLPVLVTLRGCTGTNNGSALPDGVQQTVAGPIVAFRPAFGDPAGVADFAAAISGVTFERVGRGIQPVQRDTVGPSLTVTPGTPTATTLPVAWTAAAGVAVEITWTTGLSVVFNTGSSTSSSGTLTITRPAAGNPPGVVTFWCMRDGIINTNTVTVPPIGSDTVTPSITVSKPGGDDNYFLYFQASAENPRTSTALPVTVTLANCTATVSGVAFTSGSTLSAADTLKVARPAFGNGVGSVLFSATAPSSGEIHGGTATARQTIPESQRDTSFPAIEVDSAKNGDVATAWVKFTERGIAVTDVQVQTRVGTVLVSALSAPHRTAGDASVVRGGTLGAGEYEEDVPLGGARQLSEVDFYATLAGIATPISVPPFYFDRLRTPRFVRVVVDGTMIDAAADAVDTLSLRAFTSDVDDSDPDFWEEAVDGSFYLFNVPVDASETRAITVQAFAEPSGEVTVDTPKDERYVTVSGASAPTEPAWDVASVDIPDFGDDTISIGARANSTITGYTAAYFIRYNGGAYTEITGDLIPTAGAVPTTLATYTYPTGWTRGTPPGISIEVSVRFDILDGTGAQKATQTTTRSYTIS